MKAHVFDVSGNRVEEVNLPSVFQTEYRPDVIRRAVLAQQSSRRQRYGADPLAGKRSSAHYHGLRRYRFSMMNKEMSRLPRIHGKGAGVYAYTARIAPHAVKGRRAHPPKAEKSWVRGINRKERQLAIKSALAACASTGLVKKRGHKTESAPLVLAADFEDMKRTKDIMAILKKLLPEEMERCSMKKVRAGRGKMRNRRYRRKKGPLVIASRDCSLLRAARNIAGVDAASAANINAELLAPGADAGRLLVVTKPALVALQKKYGE